MIGQTTNQANNPPKDGTILPPTIDVDKHELTEQELADMTAMRLAERIQQMEEAAWTSGGCAEPHQVLGEMALCRKRRAHP